MWGPPGKRPSVSAEVQTAAYMQGFPSPSVKIYIYIYHPCCGSFGVGNTINVQRMDSSLCHKPWGTGPWTYLVLIL